MFRVNGAMHHQVGMEERVQLVHAVLVKALLGQTHQGEHGFKAVDSPPLAPR